MNLKVAVTETEFRKAEKTFRDPTEGPFQCLPVPAAERELAASLRQEHIPFVVLGPAPYSGPLYEALPPGGVLARFGVGHDGLDKTQATTHGLLCTNTPGVLNDSVAEHAVNLLLSLARQTLLQANRVRAGQWSPQLGVELRGKQLTIVGCGGIGRQVARMAARAFSMKVVGLTRSVLPPQPLAEEYGFSQILTDFNQAVREADFLSLHLPSVPETRHYLNPLRLQSLRPGCFLVNTARGALVDEIALYDALASGHVAGAALDVFEEEPYRPQAPNKDLRQLPNVLMTPHIASSTQEACVRMARRALRNIHLASLGRYAGMDLLNRDVLARIPPGTAASSATRAWPP